MFKCVSVSAIEWTNWWLSLHFLSAPHVSLVDSVMSLLIIIVIIQHFFEDTVRSVFMRFIGANHPLLRTHPHVMLKIIDAPYLLTTIYQMIRIKISNKIVEQVLGLALWYKKFSSCTEELNQITKPYKTAAVTEEGV